MQQLVSEDSERNTLLVICKNSKNCATTLLPLIGKGCKRNIPPFKNKGTKKYATFNI